LAPERALCSRERFFGVQAVLAIAAASAIASVPLTFAVIMPVNMRLKAIKDAKAKGTGVEGKFFLLARPVADNPS
jgi:hypothetical protein